MRGRMELMATKSQRAPRRTEALSRDVIVKAATEILDAEGEDALTLRALTVRLTHRVRGDLSPRRGQE